MNKTSGWFSLKVLLGFFGVITAVALLLVTSKIGHQVYRYYRFEKPFVYYKNDQVVLNGRLSPELLTQFDALHKKHDFTNKRLVVRSTGGLILIGLEFGKRVRDLQMDVEVRHFCISSCANYIFPAARKKFLHPDSGLIYHGGLRQKNIRAKSENPELQGPKIHEASVVSLSAETVHDIARHTGMNYQQFNNLDFLIAEETAFYQSIGVNPLITIYSQLGEYEAAYKTGNHIGFHYIIEDLKKFGVENVEMLGEGDWRPHTNPYNGSPYWVKVDVDMLASYTQNMQSN